MSGADEITFIVNGRGEKTHAILPMASYRKLLQVQAFLEQPHGAGGEGARELYYLRMRNLRFGGSLEACGYPVGRRAHPRFIIARDSQVKFYAAGSLKAAVAQLREQLIEDRTIVLRPEQNCFCFTRDYEVSSPSLAAALVSGTIKNGLDVWISAQGFSLKDSGFGPHGRSPRRARS